MQITDNQDIRLALLFPGTWRFTKRLCEGNDGKLVEMTLDLLHKADEQLNSARRARWSGYSLSRHMAIKAMIKELETGEPARDPMVEVATNAIERN
jgi:hypothetical protein